MKLTQHFSMSEFTASRIAKENELDNYPPLDVIPSIKFTAAGMERLRACLCAMYAEEKSLPDSNIPIHITSGFRSHDVNELAGGAEDSQHLKGEAVDFICPAFGTPKEICLALEPFKKMLGIDQLIWEGTWVHCSFTLNPRGSVLSLVDGHYVEGLS